MKNHSHKAHHKIHVHKLSPKIKHHHPDSILNKYRGKLKLIESLRGIYAGREIWILATGPSLDDIPDDFLEIDETIDSDLPTPKISIAVKEAAIPFPNCTYNIWTFRARELRHVYLPRGIIPKNFKKFIFSIRKSDNINFFGPQAFKSIYMRFGKNATMGNLSGVCEAIIAGTSSSYCGVGTITHLAIEAAVIMGASKISLVGCDHGRVNGKIRAQNRGISLGYNWADGGGSSGYECMAAGTDFLADFFRDHGIEIVRYYHDRGYEPIGKAKEEVEDEPQIM